MLGSFVGRRAELAVLRARRDQVMSGYPQVVLVQGAPGIGKTWLVDHFLGELAGLNVLRASGEELESHLTYGVVKQLLRAADVPLAGSAGAAVADPVTMGVRLLDMLGEIHDAGPVTIVVDDARWADPLSLKALLLALRRLHSDQVLTLFTARDREGQPRRRRAAAAGGTAVRPGPAAAGRWSPWLMFRQCG
jgi:predicted ATPase